MTEPQSMTHNHHHETTNYPSILSLHPLLTARTHPALLLLLLIKRLIHPSPPPLSIPPQQPNRHVARDPGKQPNDGGDPPVAHRAHPRLRDDGAGA